jgi:hypothetical protein
MGVMILESRILPVELVPISGSRGIPFRQFRTLAAFSPKTFCFVVRLLINVRRPLRCPVGWLGDGRGGERFVRARPRGRW